MIIEEEKKRIRDEVRKLKAQMTEEETDRLSDKLCSKLFELPCYIKADIILGYMPANQEIDVRKIERRAACDGKMYAVPVTFPERRMEFFLISEDTVFIEKRGIKEPSEHTALLDVMDLAGKNVLMIMPGLAFSKEGWRTGYGGGYYDRYLDRIKDQNITTVALCYGFQVYDHVPHDEYDMKFDILLDSSSL